MGGRGSSLWEEAIMGGSHLYGRKPNEEPQEKGIPLLP